MNEKIKLIDLFGAEIRSRSNADDLRESIKKNHSTIVDLYGVSFMSRSFTDELCIIVEQNDIKIINANGIVESMISAVSESRKKKRIRKKEDSEIKEFFDLKSLSDFLATI